MTVNEYLIKQRESKELSRLFKAGLLSSKIFLYHEIYLKYDILMKQGETSMQAVYKCEWAFKVSEKTIFNAIKFCRQEL